MAAFENFLLTHTRAPCAARHFSACSSPCLFWSKPCLRRRQQVSAVHYGGNLLLGGLNIVLLRLIAPAGLVGIALWQTGGGLLGALNLPLWATCPLSGAFGLNALCATQIIPQD